MPKRGWCLFFIASLLIVLAIFAPSGGAKASSAAIELTPFPTPTPGADGIIRYKVKPGDSLWRIAAVAGISVEKLRALNNMEPNEGIRVGEILILGIGVSEKPTPTATEGMSPKATPTPTAVLGEGTLCVLLYNDKNGNGLYEEDLEQPIPGGAINVTNRAHEISLNGKTKSDDFTCYQALPEGQYTISIGVPSGYNPTTETTAQVDLQAGDTTYVTFGAQKAVAPPEPQATPQKKHSPLLGLLGAVFILLALVTWWYGRRFISSQYH